MHASKAYLKMYQKELSCSGSVGGAWEIVAAPQQQEAQMCCGHSLLQR